MKYKVILFKFLDRVGHHGQKEYCKDCLGKGESFSSSYSYWRVNEGMSSLKPVGECSHK